MDLRGFIWFANCCLYILTWKCLFSYKIYCPIIVSAVFFYSIIYWVYCKPCLYENQGVNICLDFFCLFSFSLSSWKYFFCLLFNRCLAYKLPQKQIVNEAKLVKRKLISPTSFLWWEARRAFAGKRPWDLEYLS